MFSASTKKHSCESTTTSGDTKRPRVSDDCNAAANDFAGFNAIPVDCGLRVLSFLTEEDVPNAAQMSRSFWDASHHDSLSQSRTAVVACGSLEGANSSVALFETLVAMHKTGKFSRFNKVKITQVANMGGKVTMKQVNKIARRIKVRDVNALDLSRPVKQIDEFSYLLVYPKALMSIMPNLREIDLSNTHYRMSVLQDLAKKCPDLEKLTWNNRRYGLDVMGIDLVGCKKLKELYMDNTGFFNQDRPDFMQNTEWFYTLGTPLLFYCKELVRVSLKNAHDHAVSEKNRATAELPLPQSALKRFVQGTPTLRWFRSDLTPENVALLQTEHPEITFVS